MRYLPSCTAAVVLILFHASAAQAVEDREKSGRQEQQREDHAAQPSPLVSPLDPPKDAQGARDQQQKAERREIRDLAAQEGMNRAAQKMLGLSWLQVFLTALGTIALLYSLMLNRRATNAAIDVVRAERAWLTIDDLSFDVDPGQETTLIVLPWRNTGRSPAVGARYATFVSVEPKNASVPRFEVPGVGEHGMPGNTLLGPGRALLAEARISKEDIDRIARKEKTAFLYCRVEYRDIYTDDWRHTEVTSRIVVADKGGGRLGLRLNVVGDQNTHS